ncbi:hypothetical protein Trydic_g8968 [Trypoxylus dichotomus]
MIRSTIIFLIAVVLIVGNAHVINPNCHIPICSRVAKIYCYKLPNGSVLGVMGNCAAADFQCHHPEAVQINPKDENCAPNHVFPEIPPGSWN